MTIQTVNDGESAVSIRNKLNSNFQEHTASLNSSPQFERDPITNIITGLRSPEGSVPGSEFSLAVTGMSVTVNQFDIGIFSFAGGSIVIPSAGTWYVGVEMSSKQLRCLPRLGHSGWLPVAKIIAEASSILNCWPISPVLPKCRIPRTLAKITSGKPINVLIMGSSLMAADSSSNYWPGMVFGSGTADKYRLPGTVNLTNVGVGGAPSSYQLSQLGFSSDHGGGTYTDSGAPGPVNIKKQPPNGRSKLFNNVDLVVIGCLANGGDYRLEMIEPIVRKLRTIGVEVIIVTDNPQNPTTNYSTLINAPLFIDGPEVFRVAELYGIEVADTAAYVFEAHLRAGGVGIYGDIIHQAGGSPAGPLAVLPANGHEAWARAIRSIFPVFSVITQSPSVNISHDFSTGISGWTIRDGAGAYQTITAPSGALVATKTSSSPAQWGMQFPLSTNYPTGTIIQVSGTISFSGGAISASIGILDGSWASNTSGIGGGPFSATLVSTRSANSILILVNPDNAALGSTMTLDNFSMSITPSAVFLTTNTALGRSQEILPLPPIRVVTDFATPADAFVILPKMEMYFRNAMVDRGVLGASPWGAGSFARRWSSNIGSSEDLLILATGKKAVFGAECPVGYSLIHYRDVADGPCSFDIYRNGTKVNTINISTVPFANEWIVPVFSPTELAVNVPVGPINSFEIVVTSGTLKIAALVGLTADIEYVCTEDMEYAGAWLPREVSRSGFSGAATDTAGAAVSFVCKGRRVSWLVSGNPGSKTALAYSDKDQASINMDGNYHVFRMGNVLGTPGSRHTLECTLSNASGSQANGRAMHVIGAIVLNDR